MTSLLRTSALILAAASFSAPALAGGDYDKKKDKTAVMGMTEAGPNIVETAASVDSLSTLVTVVEAAELADALSAEGPLTVFAPTNTAFDGLPAGTLDTLLEADNQYKLKKVLKSHVVSGSFDAATLIQAASDNGGTAEVETLSGATLTAVLDGDTLYVRDEMGGLAEVAQADVKTSNGVVHVVTSVLLPESK